MAYARERKKADGTRFFEIRAYSSEKKKYFTKYYYPHDGWSDRSTMKEVQTLTEAFQRDVDAGLVLSKKEKAEAEKAAAAKAALLKTFRQYATSVFMPIKELSIAENTRLSYWSNLEEHIFPVIGDELIKDISPAMISSLLLDFQKNHSFGSAVKVYNILGGVFKMAYRDDSIDRNPMDKVDRPKQKKDDKAISEADKSLVEEELLHVLDCVSKEPLKWQAFLYLAADTGCRRGELVGMQWQDIDWKRKTVTVKHNLQYSKGKTADEDGVIYDGVYDATPKGGRFRTVDLGDDTIQILEKYREALLSEDDEAEAETVIDFNQYQNKKAEKKLPKWIFTQEGEDQPMFPHAPTRYFQKFGERYGISGFHPHLLRHTSASLSLTNGGDVKSIAERLGHKDAAVTLRMYAHANDESIRAAGQAARDSLKRKRESLKKEQAAAN